MSTRRVVAIIAAVAVVAAAVVVTVVFTTAGSSAKNSKGPRPVTSEEAGRLANMRVKNFEAVGVAFHTVIVSAQGAVTVNGDVDFHTLTGYAEVSAPKGASYTLQWNAESLVAWPSRGKPTMPPTTVPVEAPRERALTPATSGVDAVLALVLGLGESKPDDAKQVQQGGATWIGTSTIDGTTVDVMEGPSIKGSGPDKSLDYWVDASGHLRRVDVALKGSTTPTQIDLDPSTFFEVRSSRYLTGNGAS